jgi:hypothetical protein
MDSSDVPLIGRAASDAGFGELAYDDDREILYFSRGLDDDDRAYLDLGYTTDFGGDSLAPNSVYGFDTDSDEKAIVARWRLDF